MAQRETIKKARSPRRGPAPVAAEASKAAQAEPDSGQGRVESRAGELERKLDSVMAELEAARRRIIELESMHDLAVNRIDWVLDSLHNLVEQES